MPSCRKEVELRISFNILLYGPLPWNVFCISIKLHAIGVAGMAPKEERAGGLKSADHRPAIWRPRRRSKGGRQ